MKLIYNQHEIPAEKWRYGFRPSSQSGCGWIATYNALALMHYRVDPEKLIYYYEMQVPVVHGNLGTSFWGPAAYFTQWGFPVTTTFRREEFDRVAARSDVAILFYRWRRGCQIGAHFVAVTHDDRGFTGYNTFQNSTGPDFYGKSLEEFLRKRKYFGAVLLGIRDKRK